MITTRRGLLGIGLTLAGAAVAPRIVTAQGRAGGRVLRFLPEFDLRIPRLAQGQLLPCISGAAPAVREGD